jgi:hypothetical protein
MLYTDEDLFEAGRTIRGELPDLLPPETAKGLDDRLSALLNDDRLSGLLNQVPFDRHDLDKETISTISAIADQIEEVLKTNEITKNWLQSFLTDLATNQCKGFEPLAGNPNYVAADKYICPYGDYRWSRRNVGQAIPRCPTHDVLLIPIREFQQLRSNPSQDNP